MDILFQKGHKGVKIYDMWFRFYSAGYRGYNLQMPLLKYRESLNDYNKRTLKSALTISQTTFIGYKNDKMSFHLLYLYC